MRSKRSWGSSMMSSGSWVLTSLEPGSVMSLVTSVTSWSHDSDASPTRSRDESREGSRSRVVMGSGGGSRDKKSGGSELGRDSLGSPPDLLSHRLTVPGLCPLQGSPQLSGGCFQEHPTAIGQPGQPLPAIGNRKRRNPRLFESHDASCGASLILGSSHHCYSDGRWPSSRHHIGDHQDHHHPLCRCGASQKHWQTPPKGS